MKIESRWHGFIAAVRDHPRLSAGGAFGLFIALWDSVERIITGNSRLAQIFGEEWMARLVTSPLFPIIALALSLGMFGWIGARVPVAAEKAAKAETSARERALAPIIASLEAKAFRQECDRFSRHLALAEKHVLAFESAIAAIYSMEHWKILPPAQPLQGSSVLAEINNLMDPVDLQNVRVLAPVQTVPMQVVAPTTADFLGEYQRFLTADNQPYLKAQTANARALRQRIEALGEYLKSQTLHANMIEIAAQKATLAYASAAPLPMG